MAAQKISAGLLLYRRTARGLEVLLVHPGGPFWKNKDEGAWSVPKGETDGETDFLAVAKREFFEETSFAPETCAREPYIALQPVKQKSGKIIHAFAAEGDLDAARIRSNTCLIEWPPRSGRQLEIPEVDKAQWFSLAEAKEKINAGQRKLVEELGEKLA
jgi:predicted NUDIX family NTP pyrophosphohydrolase